MDAGTPGVHASSLSALVAHDELLPTRGLLSDARIRVLVAAGKARMWMGAARPARSNPGVRAITARERARS